MQSNTFFAVCWHGAYLISIFLQFREEARLSHSLTNLKLILRDSRARYTPSQAIEGQILDQWQNQYFINMIHDTVGVPVLRHTF